MPEKKRGKGCLGIVVAIAIITTAVIVGVVLNYGGNGSTSGSSSKSDAPSEFVDGCDAHVECRSVDSNIYQRSVDSE